MDFHDSVSSLSHLATSAWAVFATLLLMRLTVAHGPKRWSVAFFGLTMVLLYLASGLYHGLRHDTEESRLLFQKLDKSAIFLFIFGSNVPIQVYLLRGAWRFWTMTLSGSAALLGILVLWVWPTMPHPLLVAVYLVLGLAGLVMVGKVAPLIGRAGVAWFLGFAACYVLGALVELAQWPVLVPGWFGPHEFLHIADCGGTFGHLVLIVKYVLPYGDRRNVIDGGSGSGHTGMALPPDTRLSSEPPHVPVPRGRPTVL
jgi:hemolysin III